MSAITSVQTDGQGLLSKLLQRPTANPQISPPEPPVSSDPTLTPYPISAGPVPAESGPHQSHGHGQNLSFKRLQDAVTAALRSVQPGDTTDPNKVIEDTIAQYFSENGVTRGAHGLLGKASSIGRSGAASDSAQSATNDDSTHQAFIQTLQAVGVNSDQFRNDFFAAIKDAQGGQINAGTAFKSLPVGSAVDTIA